MREETHLVSLFIETDPFVGQPLLGTHMYSASRFPARANGDRVAAAVDGVSVSRMMPFFPVSTSPLILTFSSIASELEISRNSLQVVCRAKRSETVPR